MNWKDVVISISIFLIVIIIATLIIYQIPTDGMNLTPAYNDTSSIPHQDDFFHSSYCTQRYWGLDNVADDVKCSYGLRWWAFSFNLILTVTGVSLVFLLILNHLRTNPNPFPNEDLIPKKLKQ